MVAAATSVAATATLVAGGGAAAGAPGSAVSARPGADRLPSTVAELPRRVVLTTTVGGRRVVAVRQGPADATRVILVVGQMHGSEPDTPRVVAALRRATVPEGVQLWTIATMNPDGRAVGSRYNARGVDLNRNFPVNWDTRLNNEGPRPASERETRAMLDFVSLLSPDAVLSYHQPFGLIDVTGDKTRPWAKRLARWIGLRPGVASCVTVCGGTMTGWINATLPGWAITVELPPVVDQALIRRNVDAILRVSTLVDDVALPVPASAQPTPDQPTPDQPTPDQPTPDQPTTSQVTLP